MNKQEFEIWLAQTRNLDAEQFETLLHTLQTMAGELNDDTADDWGTVYEHLRNAKHACAHRKGN